LASVQELEDQLHALIERASVLLADASDHANAIEVAAQTHRLDLVSVLLTAVTIILAVGGLFAFFEIRYRAKLAAQETARNECRSIAKKLLKNYVNDELPSEVRRLVELIMQEKGGNGGDYGQQDTGEIQS
jgi:hypothetical protein